MAAVTQANVDFVKATKVKASEVAGAAVAVGSLLGRVYSRIKLSEAMNDGVDWDDTVATYTPEYNAKLSELKTLAESLPGWSTA